MRKRAWEKRGLNVGMVTIVVVFTVLCLTIFAVLALSTADGERRLAEKYAASVTEYYAADLAASETAAQFVGLSPASASALADTLGFTAETRADGVEISYLTPVNEGQALYAALRVTAAGTTRVCWQLVETGTWQPETGERVWTGEDILP